MTVFSQYTEVTKWALNSCEYLSDTRLGVPILNMISLLDLYLLLIGTCGVSIISAKSLFVPGAEGESNAGQPQGDKLDFCTSTKSCVTLKKKTKK